MESPVRINGRAIGPGHPVYVVAELSANHNQSLESALELVEAARAAGADAVKLQTYKPETMTLRSDSALFRISEGTLWKGRSLFDLYSEAFTPWEWHPLLKNQSENVGLDFFSTPFDASAVEFLEELRVPAYKIASFELVDLPLLRRVAATGKPVILSTGMATKPEIQEAVDTLRSSGADQLVLLRCNSAYPAEPRDMNLRSITDMLEAFGTPVGLSDHTLDATVPVAAVALGACVIEKHLTLSRSLPGPDSAFSLEPAEFKAMVDAVRSAEQALGSVTYGPTERERPSLVFRRSLFVVAPVRQGEPFTRENVRAIRPGYGLHTRHLEDILERVASRDIGAGTPLGWELVLGGPVAGNPDAPWS